MINKVAMVVDDETETLALLEVLLRRLGFAVMKARTAGLALHLVKSLKPNLFVLDDRMPDSDGFELCRQLRASPHTAQVPVIMVSACDTPRTRQLAQESGANAFLPKPLLPSELSAQVSALVNNGASTAGAGTGRPS